MIKEIKVDSKWIGIPFKWGGRDFDGMDCAGLAYKFLQEHGIQPRIPDNDGKTYDANWHNDPQRFIKFLNRGGKKIPKDISLLQPYDVLCFDFLGKVRHIGVYLGYGKFLHIYKDARSCIGRLESAWEKHWVGALRPTEAPDAEQLEFSLDDKVGDPITAIVTLVSAVVAAAGVGAAGGTLGGAIFAFAATVVLSAASYFLAPKPAQPNFGMGGVAEGSMRYSFGALQSISSSDLPVSILYGRLKISTNCIYQSDPAETVNRCDALCAGEVNSISDIRVNDIPINELSGCTVTSYTGTPAQTIDSRFSGSGGKLVPGMRNIAYLALSLQTSDKLKGGFPTVTTIIEGQKVQTWDGTSWMTEDLSKGLIAHYKLNDNASNTTVEDSSAFKYDGVATNNTSDLSTSGKINNALLFNGTDQRVNCGHMPEIESITDSFSYSCWVRRDSKHVTRAHGVIGNWQWNATTNNQRGTLLRWTLNSDTLTAIVCTTDGNGNISVPTANYNMTNLGSYLGVWYFVVVTYNKSDKKVRLYIDGRLKSTSSAGTYATPILYSPQNWYIGYNSTNAGWFNGAIDDVRVYKRILTNEEIIYLYNNGSGTESEDKRLAYSNNPAACIRDLLTNTRYGIGLPNYMIDDSSFGEVYDYCDELIDNNNGGTEKRYELDLMVDARKPSMDILTEMLGTFGGYLVWSGNRLRLKAEKADSVIQNFTMSDIVEKSFIYRYIPKDDAVNKVKVQYVDPEQNYTKVFALAEDKALQDLREEIEGNEGVVEKEISLYGITRFSQASRIANQIIKSVKAAPIGCSFRVGIKGIHCEPGDVITVSHDVPNWTNKPFRIVSIQEHENDEMELICKEYNESVYDDSYGSSVAEYQYGTPPNPLKAPENVTNVIVSESGIISKSGQYVTILNISWTLPSYTDFIQHYFVEFSKDGGDYLSVGTTTGNSIELQNADEGSSYTIRVKSINYYGVASSGSYSASYLVSGKSAPPSNVTGFSVALSVTSFLFSWDAVTDVDLYGYEIREGSTWESGTVIDTGISGTRFLYQPVIVGVHTFRIKAIDTSGNYSVTEDVDTITVTTAPDINITIDDYLWDSLDELPNNSRGVFSGELDFIFSNGYNQAYNRKSLAVRTDLTYGELEATGKTYLQLQTDPLIYGQPIASGTAIYTTNVRDAGAVYNSLLSLATSTSPSANILIELRTSIDNITWGAFETFDEAQYYNFRYYQFRFTLQRVNATTNSFLYDAVATIDVPDIFATDGGNGVDISVGGSTVYFQRSFTVPPRSLVVSTVEKSTNVVAIISEQTASSFKCTLYDKNDNSVSGKINFWARGY